MKCYEYKNSKKKSKIIEKLKFVLFSKEKTGGFSQAVGQIQKCRQPGGWIHRAGSS